MDGFAWMFCMLVLGIGALVVLYARYYMSPSDPVPRFFSFLLAFMGAMVGVVLSGNLIQLVFFWELTSLFSFLLIGYWHHRKDARRGARMALTVTGTGGLCLLAGVLVLGHIVGSYDLDQVLALGDAGARARAVLRGAGPGAAGRVHQERAVSVPLLAAPCHGGADARSRPTCIRRPWSRPGCSCWRACGRCWRGTEHWFWIVGGAGAVHPAAGRLRWRCSRTTSKGCWPIPPSRTWA